VIACVNFVANLVTGGRMIQLRRRQEHDEQGQPELG
jgi:hypothetical protein